MDSPAKIARVVTLEEFRAIRPLEVALDNMCHDSEPLVWSLGFVRGAAEHGVIIAGTLACEETKKKLERIKRACDELNAAFDDLPSTILLKHLRAEFTEEMRESDEKQRP